MEAELTLRCRASSPELASKLIEFLDDDSRPVLDDDVSEPDLPLFEILDEIESVEGAVRLNDLEVGLEWFIGGDFITDAERILAALVKVGAEAIAGVVWMDGEVAMLVTATPAKRPQWQPAGHRKLSSDEPYAALAAMMK